MRRVTNTNFPSRKYSIMAPAKCKTSAYFLMEICLQWGKRLGPLVWSGKINNNSISQKKNFQEPYLLHPQYIWPLMTPTIWKGQVRIFARVWTQLEVALTDWKPCLQIWLKIAQNISLLKSWTCMQDAISMHIGICTWNRSPKFSLNLLFIEKFTYTTNIKNRYLISYLSRIGIFF